MSNTVLIVEDNRETAVMLSAVMEDAGFRPLRADGLRAAAARLAEHRPCLIVLDLVLPDGDGLDFCAKLRSNEETAEIPVIALTGKETLPDKRKGFAAGVDQYLTKPIDMAELVMWVKALLRRVHLDKAGGTVLRTRDLEIDARAQIVRFRERALERLTRREFQLLYALVKNSPKIMSRTEILAHVWRTVAVGNLVDTHLFNLRRKLPPELQGRVQAVPGKGYRYLDQE